MSDNAAFRAVRRLLQPAVADQGCSGTGDARETALTTAPSRPRGTAIAWRSRPKHGHGQPPPAHAAWVILVCLSWVGWAMVPGGACAQLPQDAAAIKLAPEAGVNYYSYIRFRPADTDSFADGCDIGSTEASALAEGDYLFQILVLPANAWHGNGVSPKEPYNRLQSPWGAIRGQLEVGKSDGKPAITYRSPLITGTGGSAPVTALNISPEENVWGRDATGKNTFGEALPYLRPIVRLGADGAEPVSQTEKELALLKALCKSAVEQGALNPADKVKLLRLDRGLAQGLDWLDLPQADNPEAAAEPKSALAAMSLFVAPDQPLAPSLDALVERIGDDTAFTRAGYLQGDPDEDYKQLFDDFRGRLQALNQEAITRAKEAPEAARLTELRQACQASPERGCEANCLDFLTDEQRKRCAELGLEGRGSPLEDAGGKGGTSADPRGPKLGLLLIIFGGLILTALLVFLLLARRAERQYEDEQGEPLAPVGQHFYKRLLGLRRSDDKRPQHRHSPRNAMESAERAESADPEAPDASQDDLRKQVDELVAQMHRVSKHINPMPAPGPEAEQQTGQWEAVADLRTGLDALRKELSAHGARLRDLEERMPARSLGIDGSELEKRVEQLVAKSRPTSLADLPEVRTQIKASLEHGLNKVMKPVREAMNQNKLRLEDVEARLHRVEAQPQRFDSITRGMAASAVIHEAPSAERTHTDTQTESSREATVPAPGPADDWLLPFDDPMRAGGGSALSGDDGAAQPAAPGARSVPMARGPAPASQDAPAGLPAPPSLSPSTERLRDQLQRTLETLKVFQPEGWEDLWEGFSEQRLDQFLKQLVGLYLPDNLPERALEEIDTWLADAFGGRAGLIRPRPGDALDPTAHRAVSTVPRSQGAFNIVHSLIRAGARCDERVVRQAQVVRVA
jgi:hypothetical protein